MLIVQAGVAVSNYCGYVVICLQIWLRKQEESRRLEPSFMKGINCVWSSMVFTFELLGSSFSIVMKPQRTVRDIT